MKIKHRLQVRVFLQRVVPELKTEVKEKLQKTYQLLSPFGEGVPDTLEGRQAALVEVCYPEDVCITCPSFQLAHGNCHIYKFNQRYTIRDI